MANGCTVFGGIIPNVYIDRVFLEESLRDTNNDGTVDLQTPVVTISLKLIDQLSENGTYSLLEDALKVQNPNEEIDFKKYLKVYCVIAASTNANDYFEDAIQQATSLDDVWHDQSRPDTLFVSKKTLDDFTCTYTNSDGNIELIAPYTLDFSSVSTVSTLEYLSIFAYVELDTDALEGDLNLELPTSLTDIHGRIEQEIVIQNSQVVSLMKGYQTEGDTTVDHNHIHAYRDLDADGSGYTEYAVMGQDGFEANHRHQVIRGVVQRTGPGSSAHTHELAIGYVAVSNVQDFRDEIDILAAEFTALATEQNNFPERRDIIAQLSARSSYFSEIFVTKDTNRNARFFFAFDYGKYILESSAYSGIISRMGEETKQKIIDNSKLTKFILSRRQVEAAPARNRLGSPVQNFVFKGAMETPIILSLDDLNINEIDLIVPEQTTTSDSLIRYFTGLDSQMSTESDGFYQYLIDIEVLDGFVPLIKNLYLTLSNASAEYQKYIALTQIPNVYDAESRKFTVSGQAILSAFDPDKGESIIATYIDTLTYFVDLSGTVDINGGSVGKTQYYADKIRSLISPSTGGIDGVLLFNDLLTLLLFQINNIIKVGHSGGGVEDTLSNQPSDAAFAFKPQGIEAREIFDNTIGARFIKESYVDNISVDKLSTFSGLSVYTQSELENAAITVVDLDVESDLNQSSEEALGSRNITLTIAQTTLKMDNIVQPTDQSSNYIGKGPGSLGNLNTTLLSLGDLADTTIDFKIDGLVENFLASTSETTRADLVFAKAAVAAPLESVDVLVGFVVPQVLPIAVSKASSGNLGAGASQPLSADKLMIRKTKFETKSTSHLVQAGVVPGNRYYLCRQWRENDIDVVDSYFLVKPGSVSVTPALAAEFLEIDTSVLAIELSAISENLAQSAAVGALTTQGIEIIDNALREMKTGVMSTSTLDQLQLVTAKSSGPISDVDVQASNTINQALDSIASKISQGVAAATTQQVTAPSAQVSIQTFGGSTMGSTFKGGY